MLSRDQLLIWLTQECCEVAQAATKCILHGYDLEWPGYGVNHEALAKEIGDLLGVIDSLQIDRDLVEQYRRTKLARMTAPHLIFTERFKDGQDNQNQPNRTKRT